MPEKSGMTAVGLDAWIRKLDRAGRDVRQAPRAWAAQAEAMFDRSQEVVHVLSGRLKASGEVEYGVGDGVLWAEIRYGGETREQANYAPYEHARGDSHAFLRRAFAETSAEWQKAWGVALAEIWEES